MSLETIESAEPIESVEETVDIAVGEEASPAAEMYQSAAALELRLVLMQDQLRAAAVKVNLLHDMGLTRTGGYAEAFATYTAKLADLTQLKARLGLA